MKRLLQVFDLTVGEQRVVILLVAGLVLFAAGKAYFNRPESPPPAANVNNQPSPSPGIFP